MSTLWHKVTKNATRKATLGRRSSGAQTYIDKANPRLKLGRISEHETQPNQGLAPT